MEETKNVTVQQLDELCKRIADQRLKCDAIDAELTENNKELAALEMKAVEYLDALGRSSYKSAFGTIGFREEFRWNLPASPDAWKQLFQHFKERDIYEGMVTVNSQKLNSFAKQEYNLAIEEGRGMEFYIPGLEQPKLFKKPTFRRG